MSGLGRAELRITSGNNVDRLVGLAGTILSIFIIFGCVTFAFADEFSKQISGMQFVGSSNEGAPEQWANAYQLWRTGFATANITLPKSGEYEFTVRASIKAGGGEGAQSELRLDQTPLGYEEGYSQMIESTQAADYYWKSMVFKGEHKIQISFMNKDGNIEAPDSLLIYSVSVQYLADDPRDDADGHRDPGKQPYAVNSIWNTSIGSGAVWSSPSDPGTIDLMRRAGSINAGQWSMPIYFSSPLSPTRHFSISDKTYPIDAVDLNPPSDAEPAEPAAGGDHHMIVYDNSRRFLYHFFDCSKQGDGFSCGQSQKDDTCGSGLGGYGWGSGVIRRWELESGTISHMLRYSLPVSATKAGKSWISGLAWPAMRSDYNGPNGLYKGSVLYGSTIGIPSDVDLDALGLSKDGLTLAHTLQDYGALQRDTGGRDGIIFYAEPSSETTSKLDAMRKDLIKIVPVLRILRNQAPSSLNGGGARRRPSAEPLDPSICGH